MTIIASRYWRHILLGLLVTLPFAILLVLGVVWVVSSGWMIAGLAAMAISTATSWALILSIRNAQLSGKETPGDPRWSPTEQYAWRQVGLIADEAEATPPDDIDSLQKLADKVIHTVASNIHGKSQFAWATFTVPELLGAIEHAAAHSRQCLRQRVPGIESVRVSSLLSLHGLYEKHRGLFRAAFVTYRIIRAAKNPIGAAITEVKDLATDGALNSSGGILKGMGARLFVEELGRSVINLYGGRYRLPAVEAVSRITAAAPVSAEPVPIRVLLTGQVNSGKSSLTNALLGAIKSPVSELPISSGVREFRIRPNDELDLIIVDTPGLTSSNDTTDYLLKNWSSADLVIWVSRANNPARDTDLHALTALRSEMNLNPDRRAPQIILAMTHIDLVSPVREWSPPYDIEESSCRKATNIADALKYTAQVLQLEHEPIIPIALRPSEAPYNLDQLWQAISAHLSTAQLVALDRELKEGGIFSVADFARQTYAGSRFMLKRGRTYVFGTRETQNQLRAQHSDIESP